MRVGDGETNRSDGRIFVSGLIVDSRNRGRLIVSRVAANFGAIHEDAIQDYIFARRSGADIDSLGRTTGAGLNGCFGKSGLVGVP